MTRTEPTTEHTHPGAEAARHIQQDVPSADPSVLTLHRTFTHARALAHAHLSREYAAMGLSIPRFNLLRWVHHAPDQQLTMGQLSALLGVSAPNVTKLVDGLEREGWVTRTTAPADRRSIYIRLTPRGEEDFLSALPRVVTAWEEMWGALNPQERQQCIALLEKFIAHFA